MKNTFLKTIGAFALAILMSVMFTQISVFAQTKTDEPQTDTQTNDFFPNPFPFSNPSIVGAWRTAVTLRNCQTGLPVSPVGRGLITFNEGGTLSEYNGSPALPPAMRSPGHGVWEQRSVRRFPGVFEVNRYSGVFVVNRYDATGVFIGIQKITAAWELSASGNDFTSNATVEIFDANDNLIATGCATSIGTRIGFAVHNAH